MSRLSSDAVVLNGLKPKTAVFFRAYVHQFMSSSPASAGLRDLRARSTYISLGVVTATLGKRQ